MNNLEANWSKTLNAFGHTTTDKVVFDSIITLLKAREITDDHHLIVTA